MRQLPSLNALRVFEEVARHRSFSRAAQDLNVTQGAVSRQIKQLEQYLGLTLFERTPQGLQLTPVGQTLVPQLNEAFDQMERSLQALRVADLRQRLRILSPPTFATRWLAPRLKDFYRQYPDIHIRMSSQFESTSFAQMDCRIRFGISAGKEGLSLLLLQEQHIAVASPELFNGDQPPSLDQYPLLHIMHENEQLPIWRHWLAASKRHDIDPDRGLEFSTLDQVIHLALAGGGLAVIDRHMIEHELNNGSLRPISRQEITGPYGYWLEIPGESQGLSKVSLFTRWLCAQAEQCCSTE